MSRKLKKINCRACQGKASQRGYFYRCHKKSCGAVFWHRAVLSENLGDDKVYSEVLRTANVPKSRGHYVYVILLDRLSGELINSAYVGSTGRHPFERYLYHLKGTQSSRYPRKRGKAMLYFEGPMSFEKSQIREKQHADELRAKNIYHKVYGPTLKQTPSDPNK